MSPTQVPSATTQAVNTYSVFDVLNIFCACWFLNCNHLLSLVTFAQKAKAGNNVTWLEVSPQSHSHLVCQAIALAPSSYPLALVKRVMFVFILEVINNSHSGFKPQQVCQDISFSMPAPCIRSCPLAASGYPCKGASCPSGAFGFSCWSSLRL